MIEVEAPTCPKCKHKMLVMPETEWSLWEQYSVDAICPNCLHVERVRMILVERARREDK